MSVGFPPPVNVVNRAYQMYRLGMPIWSFCSKTYIVIPTCTSDISLPFSPLLPAIAVDLRIEGQVCVGLELPGGWCQTYVTGSKGVFPLGEWEKYLMSVSGRLNVGLIRCTGRYDNISLFCTKDLPSFINNRLSSCLSECTAARFKYPANRPGGGGRYSLPLHAVSSPLHSPLSSLPEWTCVA